ncbi:Arc family DNA-binding protein [Streptomyces sp. NBC_01537]|uniref:Arc family DNA-binding protein n=1 Tax=Streptomyces sp. NBC_01537 TaxID=2903896 RepID=UPI00386F31FC
MDEQLRTITVRMPADLHQWLTAQAKANRRSLNAEIVHRFEADRAAAVADGESP